MKLSELDKLLDGCDYSPILNSQVRQVRWLYNNSNKLTKVYEEKLVRLMVHRLEIRVNALQKFLKEKGWTICSDCNTIFKSDGRCPDCNPLG